MVYTFKEQSARTTERVVATILTPEGLISIRHCIHSGKVLTREKIDTVTKVFHPGIIIGVDKYNRLWVAHNHYLNKMPMFELCSKFLEGKPLLWDNRPVKYTRDEIVERAIAEVRLGKTYNSLNYNCQTFVNLVVRNEHKSEAVDKISDGTMAIGGVAALLGLVFNNKALLYTGLGIAGVSGAAKGYSRIR